MRANEFKLRQKEACASNLTPEQRRSAARLARKGLSKKAIVSLFGCTYKDLKIWTRTL